MTQVSMPRGGTTQTRTFNYVKPNNIIGADLLSATNPENGMVTYTYDSNHRLTNKTDANSTNFVYSYDNYNRLTTLTANGNTLRTYTYDQNTIDPSYSSNINGRLATITYPVITYNTLTGAQATTTFTDMFSYETYGAIKGKRLRVTETNPYGEK